MTTIKISELHPAGYDLLADPESYMTQLDNNELDSISGGEAPFNDLGDFFGYTATATAAATAVGGAVAASLISATPGAWAGSAAAFGASAAASAMAYD